MANATESLVRVAMAGGSLVVRDSYAVEDLVRIAMALRAKGQGTLTIRSTDATAENMVRVAMAAPGQVTFDLS